LPSVANGAHSFLQLEGFTFYYYLEHRNLPTLEECQASLFPPPSTSEFAESTTTRTDDESTTTETTTPAAIESTPYVVVTPEDYLGGVADLTGEMMRLAIASVGKSLNSTSGHGDESFADIDKIGRLVREIKGGESDALFLIV